MSTTIESLELEIHSNSTSATSGITALQQSLEKLKAATKGGLGLTSIANQITKVGNAVNSINASTLGNLTGLVSAIQSLAGVKISSTLGKNLSSMTTAIDSLDIDKFTSKVKEMTTALEPLSTQMKNISAGFKSFNTNSKKVTQANNTMATSNKKSGMSFIQFGSKVVAVAYSIGRVVDLLGGLIKKSSSYIENVNLFTVSMGSYASEAKAYAEQVGEIMGIDPGEWMHHQGIFQTLATGFGISSDKAAIMSKNLTQLGYDLTSFFNLKTVEEGMEKLQSGLAGELEPLRRVGYDLSQAKLEATALELGIDKSVSSMTQAEKAMLRYYAIMTQVTTVHGDMARTLDAPANQLRIVKAQLEMLARSFGNIFIPMLNKVLPYVIAVTKVLREMVDAIASFAGFELPEVDYSGVDAVAGVGEDTAEALGGATEEAKKLKSYMLGFDELNVISPNNESSSADGVGTAFDIELPEYDFIGEATNKRVEGIVTKIKELVEPFEKLVDITKEWAQSLNLEPMGEGLESMAKSLVGEWTILGNILSWVYTEGFLPVGKWLIESGLPAFLELLSKSTDMTNASIVPLLEGIKELKVIFEPIVTWVGEVVVAVFESLGGVFEELERVFTLSGGSITNTITNLGEIISTIFKILKPILDLVIPTLRKLLERLGNVLATVISLSIGLVELIVQDVSEAFKGLGNILEPLTTFIEMVLSNVVDNILSPALQVLADEIIPRLTTNFENLWNNVFVPLGELIGLILTPIFEKLSEVLTWLWQEIITPLIGTIGNDFMLVLNGVFDILDGTVIPIVNGLIKVFEWLWTNVLSPIVDWLWDKFLPAFKLVFENISTIIENLSRVFGGLVEFIVGVFTLDVQRAFKGLLNILAGIMNDLIGAVESALNWIINGINGWLDGVDWVIESVSKLLGKDWSVDLTIQPVTLNKIPRFAEGGFPESGQAFIARENGIPEMVGSIGRRTAVANNTQIVESVASGVAEANSEQNVLLREQNELLRALLEKESGVYLDGRSLSESVDKYKREKGRVLVTGGAL